MGRLAASLVGAALLAGCGGPAPATTRLGSERELYGEGGDEATITIGSAELPPVPVVLRDDELIEDARSAAQDVTAIELAAPSRELDLRGMHAYVEDDLTRYLDACAERLATLMGLIRRLEDDTAHADDRDERTLVAGAFLGTALVHVARGIDRVELPRAVEEVASERAPLREALGAIAHPLYLRARDAYAACAERAVRSADPEIDAYRAFCDEARGEIAERARATAPRSRPAPRDERTPQRER